MNISYFTPVLLEFQFHFDNFHNSGFYIIMDSDTENFVFPEIFSRHEQIVPEYSWK